MTVDVFLSVGRASTARQESFVTALETALRVSGVNPRTVGRNDFSSKAPLKRVSEVLEQCHGTVVMAFERTYAPLVIDRPGSEAESEIADVRLPTVWNQLEAAMSYTRGLPLLVVVEHGLRDEGLLEARYDWYVQWVTLDEASLGTSEFRAVLADWLASVEAHATRSVSGPPARSAADLSVKELIGALTVPQLWATASACLALLLAIATIAYQLGAAS